MDLMQTRSLVAKVATVAAQGHRSSDEARAGWVTRARCRSINPDELFVRGAAQRKATLICRHCPVIAECLADALDNQMEFGVWGGQTARQRRALLKQHPDVVSWSRLFAARRKHRNTDQLAQPVR
jgi:WhiB family transcriptional regulator, redox-sensing transcriptional regulator